MSYQEKRTIVSILSGAALLTAYCIYAFGQSQAGALGEADLKSWANTMLVFIGIGVVAVIIIQIVFHILLSISIAAGKAIRHEDYSDKAIEKSIQTEMVEDEMGKLIELKSTQVGYFCAGIGVVAALASLALGYSPVVMLNVLFISFMVSSLLEGFVQLYFFRRGIRNG